MSMSTLMPDYQEVQSLTLEATPFFSISKELQGIHSLMEGFSLVSKSKQSSAIC